MRYAVLGLAGFALFVWGVIWGQAVGPMVRSGR